MLGLLVQNQSHRAGTHLRGKLLRRIAHQTFFSGEMVSANPGAVQMLVSEDGFDGLEIEWGTAAVDERLKHLFHVSAHLKDQVATVFDLIVGVVIMEPATLLFVEVEGEAHTGVNPTLADLAQSPYSPVLGQGVCDPRQTYGVRDRRKAVSFL